MPIAASIVRSALGAAALFLVLVPAAEAEELQCADKSVKAWGLGFSPSPEQSVEAAKKEWLAKAVTIYSDAKWETAKRARHDVCDPGALQQMRGLRRALRGGPRRRTAETELTRRARD